MSSAREGGSASGSAVLYSRKNNVAIVSMNYPPVNTLSYAVRKGLYDGVEKARSDDSVQFLVITGAGKAFCAGADITEFSGAARKGPGIIEIGDLIESCDKPVVAAIHSYAFGGGLEVALFCHYRLATKTTRVGFPEVDIGILPGAAGTQRLPRVTSLSVAMEIISTGRPINAVNALKYGVIDKIVEGDLVAEAVKFTSTIPTNRDFLQTRRLSLAPVKDAAKRDQIYEEALSRVKKRSPGMIAPISCLKAVRAAAELPYPQGLQREAALFMELMQSSQSKALQYAFFCDRSVSKWQLPSGGSHATTRPRPLRSVAVVGTGTMGSGIAVAVITAGIPTLVIDQNPKMLESGVERIRGLIEGGVKLGKRTDKQATAALALLKPINSLDQLRDVDLVIEAVFENTAIKQDMFRKLDAVCKPETILCSNTSTLSIDRIASATKRPDRVIGTHFFVPAYHMRLLENIYGRETSAETAATAMELGRRLNKITVLVGNCRGFCANRTHGIMGSETSFLVEEGASPEQVDGVQEDFGFPLGLLKVSDLSGIDIGWRIRQEILKDAGVSSAPGSRVSFLNGTRFSTLSDRLYELGRLGRKTGKGWYRYDKPGGKQPYPDEEVRELIAKHCREIGAEPRKISTQEILERCIYSVINESFRLLEEGIVSRPEEIDACWLHGFGWPRYMGGPMFYANQTGLSRIYDRVCHYYSQHPTVQHWQPSELLKRLACAQEGLESWKSYLPQASRL